MCFLALQIMKSDARSTVQVICDGCPDKPLIPHSGWARHNQTRHRDDDRARQEAHHTRDLRRVQAYDFTRRQVIDEGSLGTFIDGYVRSHAITPSQRNLLVEFSSDLLVAIGCRLDPPGTNFAFEIPTTHPPAPPTSSSADTTATPDEQPPARHTPSATADHNSTLPPTSSSTDTTATVDEHPSTPSTTADRNITLPPTSSSTDTTATVDEHPSTPSTTADRNSTPDEHPPAESVSTSTDSHMPSISTQTFSKPAAHTPLTTAPVVPAVTPIHHMPTIWAPPIHPSPSHRCHPPRHHPTKSPLHRGHPSAAKSSTAPATPSPADTSPPLHSAYTAPHSPPVALNLYDHCVASPAPEPLLDIMGQAAFLAGLAQSSPPHKRARFDSAAPSLYGYNGFDYPPTRLF